MPLDDSERVRQEACVCDACVADTEQGRVFGRCELSPSELEALGLQGATKPTSETEPLNSDIRLGEDYWRFRVGDFIHILEAARIKMVGV